MYISTSDPHIECLQLRNIKNLSVETILEISRYCQHIHTITLDSGIRFYITAVEDILKNCKKLIKFYINITPATLHINDEFKECIDEVGSRRYRRLILKYRNGVLHSM